LTCNMDIFVKEEVVDHRPHFLPWTGK